MQSIKAATIGSLMATMALQGNVLAKPSAGSAAEGMKPITSQASLIKAQLLKQPAAIQLSAQQLSSYANLKIALAGLVKGTYKPIVRTTDDGFVDAVLKPIYNNLIIRRMAADKAFTGSASIEGVEIIVGTNKKRELLIYQQVKYLPKRVFACSDSTRSVNLPCISFDKKYAQLEEQYGKNPDPVLEDQVKQLRAEYNTNPAFAAKLTGWNFNQLSTLKAAYVGMAAMPQSRGRGSQFMPAAVFVYAAPTDGQGAPGGQEGAASSPPSISPTPGNGIPGNVAPPPRGSIRSMLFNDNTSDDQILTKTSRPTAAQLIAWNGKAGMPLLASNATTTNNEEHNDDSRTAWETSHGGTKTNFNLLNGFTQNYKASVGDDWTLYDKWWTPRYWFGFELGYGYLYGIRAGFDVNTTATLSNRSQRSGNMKISMDTGNKATATFKDSGLKQSDIYDGKEILARVCQENSCYVELLGDIPGPDPLSTSWTKWRLPEINFLAALPTCQQVRSRYGDVTCNALDLLRSGEYAWPNAGKTVDLARWISPIDLFGGQLDYGIVGAKANPYVALKTSGLGYRQAWRKSASPAEHDISSETSTLTFNFSGLNNRANPLATGIDNEYDFNFSITPGVALGGNVGPWGLGPWTIDLDALTITSPTLTLYRHKGTYNGSWTAVPPAQ